MRIGSPATTPDILNGEKPSELPVEAIARKPALFRIPACGDDALNSIVLLRRDGPLCIASS